MAYLANNCREDEYLFRGQREDKPLVPKVARLIPCRGDVAAMERAMLADFRRQAHPWLELRPETEWDWLAVAQHHGLPTRLLDWSRNPLAALWFTVNQPARAGQPGVLWVLFYKSVPFVDVLSDSDPLSLHDVKIFQPNHIARRIASQAGFFTAHVSDESGTFVPLEDEPAFSIYLTKLAIPAASFETIRWDLDRCDINAASVYPGLDGLCQHVQWLHTLAPDEVESDSSKREASDARA